MERRRVIFLIPSLAGGGAERVALSLVPYLKNAFDLTLVLLTDRIDYDVPKDIELITLNKYRQHPLFHLSMAPLHILKLVNLVRRRQADCVLSFMEQANLINIAASILTGHKAIISQRVDPMRQYAKKGMIGRMIKGLSRIFYGRSDAVVCVSKRICQILEKNYRIPKDKLHFIPNPVDFDRLKGFSWNPAKERFVLNVGRFNVHHKGQDVLLKAFLQLRDDFPDLKLVFVGKGEDLKKVRQMVDDYGLGDRVIFKGWQREPERLMEKASLFVLASNYEGWPNVLVEAMAIGCPVVSTRCETGPNEILSEGKYGILVNPGDPHEMAVGIRRLLEDRQLCLHLSQVAKERAKAFRVEEISKRYETLIRKI